MVVRLVFRQLDKGQFVGSIGILRHGSRLWTRFFLVKIILLIEEPIGTAQDGFCKKKGNNVTYLHANVFHTLCSRNFQNMKLRLDFVEVWSFYRHSAFMWNHILGNSNSPKMLILTILKVQNFCFSKFEQLSSPKFT